MGFGGAGFGFNPGTAAAAPTAVIWTWAGPWRLDGLWSWVETGGGLDFFDEDELPSAYAATNASTAATTAAIHIGVAERPPASPTEARL